MRIGSCVVRHRLIVLSAIYGLCIPSPAISQPAAPAAPADFDVVEATIDGIHAAMRTGGLSCTKLVQSYLDRIAAYDQAGPKLNAVQNVNPHALKQAADLDAKFRASGEMASLHCVPVLLKDQIETDFMPTTYGSAMFKTFVPKRNATVVERLQRAGAIILAKTNMGEFAAGGAGSAFGDCHNAYDPAYFASGSSCGTGIGVAASFGAIGIGEDTGGSVRGPAAHGSLVGLRPTTPLVSRFGMMPASPSRDTIGPIARTVKDTALVLEAIAGYDPNDPLTAASYRRTAESYTAFLQPNGLRGMRLGVTNCLACRSQRARCSRRPTTSNSRQRCATRPRPRRRCRNEVVGRPPRRRASAPATPSPGNPARSSPGFRLRPRGQISASIACHRPA
jgi:amidase